MTLNQSCDLAVLAAEQQVSLPVTRYRAIFSLGWAFPDRDGISDLTMIGGFLRVVAGTTHPAGAPQVL